MTLIGTCALPYLHSSAVVLLAWNPQLLRRNKNFCSGVHVRTDHGSSQPDISRIDSVNDFFVARDIHVLDSEFFAGPHDGHANASFKLLPCVEQRLVAGEPAEYSVDVEIRFDTVFEALLTFVIHDFQGRTQLSDGFASVIESA